MVEKIAYISLVLIVIVGLISFFVDPRYEKGVWITLSALTNALTAALGAKFGMTFPGTKDGNSRAEKRLDASTDSSGSPGTGNSSGLGVSAVGRIDSPKRD